MKNSLKSCISLMFGLMAMFVLMTINLSAQATSKKQFVEQAMNKISKGFRFEIKTVPCFAGGISLYDVIDKSNNYALLREIDGNYGGHQMYQECIIGDNAKLRVMHLFDGMQITKSIRLPSSSDGNKNN